MEKFETGAVRDTGGKGRMDLLPWGALLRVSKHMEDALTHYPERNWEKGLPMHSMMDSAFRHMAKYMEGRTDEDHLAAAATNLLMALWTEENNPEMQDIPSRSVSVQVAKIGKAVAEGFKEGAKCGCYCDGMCIGGNEARPCYCSGYKSKCDLNRPTMETHE